MIKQITFDKNGSKLWISIEMNGLYYIKYQYQLWSNDKNQPPILTLNPKIGNNKVANDDNYEIVNEHNSLEPISNYLNRQIEISFWVFQIKNDDGFILNVKLFQGNNFEDANLIGETNYSSDLSTSKTNNFIHIIELK